MLTITYRDPHIECSKRAVLEFDLPLFCITFPIVMPRYHRMRSPTIRVPDHLSSESRTVRSTTVISRILLVLLCGLVLKTTLAVLLAYRDYFPPNFNSDFLFGRDAYFFGPYRWAFYTHIISGPFALINGLVLLSNSFRQRFPTWHRRLGKVQIACVFLFVSPSGLWMAWYAATGTVAAVGFATLAMLTAFTVALGWRAALQRRFDVHRYWMLRCYVLLCSAVTLRVIGGLSEVLGIFWTYPFAAWLSWLIPLAALECLPITRRPVRLQRS